MVSDKTYEKFKEYLQNTEYVLVRKSTQDEINNDKNLNDKVLIEHTPCHNQYFVRPYDFMRGNTKKCDVCFNNSNTFVSFVNSVDDYELVSKYKNDRTKVKIKHTVCGNIWDVRPSHFKSGTRCPYCSHKNHSKLRKEQCKDKVKTNEEFTKEIDILVGDEYTFLEEYGENRFDKIKCKHNVCGYIWGVRPNDFLNGHRCPKCSHKRSQLEKDMVSFIKGFYKGEIIENIDLNKIPKD